MHQQYFIPNWKNGETHATLTFVCQAFNAGLKSKSYRFWANNLVINSNDTFAFISFSL